MTKGYQLRELKIEVNRSCPLHCLHCSSNASPHAEEQLQPGKISELIREFAYLGGQKVCISGGEPLCYDQLETVINACVNTNIQMAIYTTGIVSNGGSLKSISNKAMSLLSENGIKIVFSLHGARERTHDALTQVEGSFNATMRAMDKMTGTGASIEAHVVPTAMNIQELPDMIDLLASHNIHKVSLLRLVPQGRAATNWQFLHLSKEQLVQLAHTKSELQIMHPQMAIRTGSPFNILCSQIAVPCKAGLSVLTVKPDGWVVPCDAFKQFEAKGDFGNILFNSLSQVWEESYLINKVRRIHENGSTSSCISCHLYAQCNSGCLAQKAIASGMLTDDKDPECLLNGLRECREVEAICVH